MKAQIKEGGRVYTGFLAELFVKKGIAKKIETRGRKPLEKEDESQSVEIKQEIKKPIKKTTKSK